MANGALWIATNNGLVYLDTKSEGVVSLGLPHFLSESSIEKVAIDGPTQLWGISPKINFGHTTLRQNAC